MARAGRGGRAGPTAARALLALLALQKDPVRVKWTFIGCVYSAGQCGLRCVDCLSASPALLLQCVRPPEGRPSFEAASGFHNNDGNVASAFGLSRH